MNFISILIVLVVVFVCAAFLLPFYIFRKKKSALIETHQEKVLVPFWRAILLVVAEGVLFLLVLAYFVLKAEGLVPSYLGWGAAFGAVGVVLLHIKNRKIAMAIKKSDRGFLGWTVIAYEKSR